MFTLRGVVFVEQVKGIESTVVHLGNNLGYSKSYIRSHLGIINNTLIIIARKISVYKHSDKKRIRDICRCKTQRQNA